MGRTPALGARMGEPVFRFAHPHDLRAVLRAYWKCFDATQRLRTVADSPFLFRWFYAREMKAGRCTVALAEDGGEVVGFAILRQIEGPSRPWLLSAIGVVPERRKSGTARKLFEMVATRPVVLTVEADGPVGFYESLGLRRTGEQTLLYMRRPDLGVLRGLAREAAAVGGAVSARRINWKATFVKAPALTSDVVRLVEGRARLGGTVIVELPGRLDAFKGSGVHAVFELRMETPPALPRA